MRRVSEEVAMESWEGAIVEDVVGLLRFVETFDGLGETGGIQL